MKPLEHTRDPKCGLFTRGVDEEGAAGASPPMFGIIEQNSQKRIWRMDADGSGAMADVDEVTSMPIFPRAKPERTGQKAGKPRID